MGGLTAVKCLQHLAPRENIVFFGDNARIPYGANSVETLTTYALQNISFLLSHDVKIIVAACGTISATLANRYIEKVPVPFVGVIQSAAATAAKASRNKKIGILATEASINSGAYARALKNIDSEIEPYPVACPLFVPFIEAGKTGRDNKETLDAAQHYLAPLKSACADTVILGCTHYPLISGIIGDIMDGAALIDSGYEAAKHALSLLADSGDLGDGDGRYDYYLSGETESFKKQANLFLGHELAGSVHGASIDSLTINNCFKDII